MDITRLFDDEQRRIAVRASPLNGISDVELGPEPCTLRVTLFKRLAVDIGPWNIRIEGGVRIRAIDVQEVVPEQDEQGHVTSLIVRLDRAGDFSTYLLRLVRDGAGDGTDSPLPGFDPPCSRRTFRFHEVDGGMDCRARRVRASAGLASPDIDYLARDYASLRRLVFDRLSLLVPAWQETHVPDVGVAIAEVLAYAGDRLAYQQDAVATEAYLETARLRISVRRHARLLDYRMHEGCNARTWLQATVTGDLAIADPRGIDIDVANGPARPSAGTAAAFEPVWPRPLAWHSAHNRISFHAWRSDDFRLPAGAVSATLVDAWEEPPAPAPNAPAATAAAATAPAAAPGANHQRRLRHLAPGDFLLLMDVSPPVPGRSAGADPARRHVVRLTRVVPDVDPLCDGPPIPIVHVEWAAADALPFALIVSTLGPPPACEPMGPQSLTPVDLAIACGNVLLVDHGRRVARETLDGVVPAAPSSSRCVAPGLADDPLVTPGRFAAVLKQAPLTWRDAVPAHGPASRAWERDPRAALPDIELDAIPGRFDGRGPLFDVDDLDHPTALVALLREVEPKRLDVTQAGLVLARAASPDAAPDDMERARALDLLGRLDPPTLRGLGDPAKKNEDLASALAANLRNLVMRWQPRIDLLESGPEDRHFVVETDNEGRAHLRFGDGDCGAMPGAGSRFFASYRVGCGVAGNLGTGALARISLNGTPLDGVSATNPVPARGGVEPEAIADVKRLAPAASRGVLERAITADDYARIAERDPAVQRAAATLRWDGSRYAVLVAIDPLGTEMATHALLDRIAHRLDRSRRIGHRVEVRAARYVPVDLAMTVRVDPRYAAGPVRDAVMRAFGRGREADGSTALFHPDNLTFGTPIDASRIVERAQRIAGVESVTVTRLQRLFERPAGELEAGLVAIGPLEIAQLDDDPDFPEHGRFLLTTRGGR
jgi:hypothetical protein